MRAEGTVSAAERLANGSSMLRRYAQGDDLRRIHWRTTARVGELMVRDDGDRDDPGQTATTVLLDVGDDATPADELDRAVEVTASVLSAAADESNAGISGAYRLVTTHGLDTGRERGRDSLQNVLVALAGVAAAPTPSPKRFSEAVARLGRPERDEVLVIIGAFGANPPDPDVLEDLARAYSVVVLVLVGAACSPTRDELDASGQADTDGSGSSRALEIGSYSPQELGVRPTARVLTVPLPLGRSLTAAWNLDSEGPDPVEDATGRRGGVREVAR
jgi:uncharacterized protein (DUF58 family)